MKRFLIAMLCVAVCVLSVFPLSACGNGNKNNGNNGGNGSHTHSFTVEVVTDEYLCSEATCTQSAKYYYSCSCGAKGTATFEYGNANGHSIVNDVCKVCKAKASKGLEFTLNDDDTYKLKGIGSCTDADIIIPKTYQGKAVTSIGNYALATYTDMGIPKKNSPKVPIERITIPDSVTTIGSYAFCGSLELKDIKIPDSVTSVRIGALAYCEKLTSITFGSGIEKFAKQIIYMSNEVASIEVSDNNTKYYSKNNCVIEKETKTLIMSCKTSVIPDEVKIIGESSFYSRGDLTNINIPDGVTSILDRAFAFCSSLTSVTIPDSVVSIGQYAFSDCNGLTSIKLGRSVEKIDDSAFSDCYKLVEIINNSNLEITKFSDENGQIGKYALNIKKGGTTDLVNKDDYLFYTFENENYLLGYEGKDTALTLPNDYNGQTYEIYRYAFYGRDDLTSVIISNGVTYINSSAFRDCKWLTSLTIGNKVNSIADNVFNNCSSLVNTIIPDSVVLIKECAFSNCSSLTSITLGKGLKEIEEYTFNECKKLVEVINNSDLDIERASIDNGWVGYYALNIKKGGTTDIVNKNGYLFYIYENVNYLLGYDGDEVNLVLPNDYNGQTYEIYKYAFYKFYNNKTLKSVAIGNGATYIGEYAFFYCGGLTNVTIGSGVTFIDKYAFINCYDLKSVKFNKVDGWKYYEDIDSENGTEVSREELSDTTSAAECLTSDYGNFYWKRG